MANNCIYRKSNGTLTAVLVKTKKITIPSKVKVIDDTVSVMGKIGTKNQVHIPKSVKKVVEDWMSLETVLPYISTEQNHQ